MILNIKRDTDLISLKDFGKKTRSWKVNETRCWRNTLESLRRQGTLKINGLSERAMHDERFQINDHNM